MAKKTLYLMCGPASVGKSTWIYANADPEICGVVSRDSIRFEKVKEGEYYFSREQEVFTEYCKRINWYLHNSFCECVYADATHINEASRMKLLNNLDLTDVEVVPVVFNVPLGQALKQNKRRTGRARVPSSAIKNMFNGFRHPKDDKFKYANIIEVSATWQSI